VSGLVRALAAAVLVVAGLTGCASSSSAGRATAGGTRLTASLDSPVDITLRWRGKAPGAAGRIVEFATAPEGPWTILRYVPLSQTSYRHPDLMPKTPFHYRVRPYYGPASQTVDVRLPKGRFSAEEQQKDHTWAAPVARPQPGVRTDRVTVAAAAPGGLRATVMEANGVRFTWTDHASDEQGQLLEDRPRGSRSFRPVAVLDPDITSFGLVTLDEEKHAAYRVRPFRYGPASNVVRLTTGQAPGGSG
jgi:hypothetical protein